MGAVHRATAPDGRPVAVKRLLDARNAARFEIEARLLARLRHPRVVRVLDSMMDDTGSYLVMDWVDGIDLADVLVRDGRPGLEPEQALDYALQVCEALRYIHGQQTVHRDVKPQNLMLAPGTGIVLVDFGIARDLDAATHTSGGIGTPGFMSPEAFLGGESSPRMDVYGAAATLWTLLAGRPPSFGERGGPPGVDGPLAATLRAALHPDPDRRLPSIEALAAGLGGHLPPERGRDLGVSLAKGDVPLALLRAVVRTAAKVFGSAAASLALTQPDGTIVYRAAWGAGAEDIVGVRLGPGEGITGAVMARGTGEVIEDCRSDPRFATATAVRTGYVPHTMLVVPLRQGGRTVGALNVLDQRSGRPYAASDLERAELLAELALAALDSDPQIRSELATTAPPELP
jgi:serine/threonine protein kinase